MIIDSKHYSGPCECGSSHAMTTEFCVIEPGCLSKMEEYLDAYGLKGRRTALYDENTYAAVGQLRPKADTEIILPPEGLHADNHGVALAMAEIPEGCDFLIAVGSGTIHDITRYCAHELGIPFVSCPTAASVDGFCSSVAAMTWNGFKKTWTAVAPKIVVADVNIISKAPMYLTCSGVGDMIGKFIALTEWKIGSVVKGEALCPKIYDMTMKATQEVVDCVPQLAAGKAEAYEKLTYGLLLSGIAMQLLGNSRCASGAEHHISHLIEMQPAGLHAASQALHGEKVGVGTLIAAREYHKLARLERVTWKPYPTAQEERVREFFGEKLYDSIAQENIGDCAAEISTALLDEKWPEIRALIAAIPEPETLEKLYGTLGLKATLADIEVPDEYQQILMEYSPLVRNRLTLMRLRRAMAL